MIVPRLIIRCVLLLTTCLLATVTSQAQSYYVRAGAGGNGSDWNNAYSSLPATLQRGATYYVAAGTYPGYTFDDANSGTALITVKKATVADHGPGANWSDAYANGVALFGGMSFSTDYYKIDGVTGGGPGQWQTGHGIKIKSGGFNISFSGPRTKIELLHMDVENNGRADATQNEHSFYGTGGISDIRVAYCYWHDVSICFFFTRGANRITVEYSKFARNGQAEWIDGLHRTAWSATTDNDMIIRHCVFEDICNTAVFSVVNGSGAADNWQIYGNVIVWTGNYQDAYCSALVDVRNDNALGVSPSIINMTASHWRVYNNSIINWIGGSSAGMRIGAGTDNLVYNNIWYKNTANEMSFWSCSHDYNWYYGNIRTAGCSPPCNLDSTGEAHGQIGTGDPFVNWQAGDYRLKAATAAGIALASPYNVDPTGITRGADGVWDRGPLEFGGVADTVAPVITGTTVSLIGPSSSVVSWTTSESSSSVVQYGTTTSYGASANNSSLLIQHQIALSGLQPNTLYHFRASSTDLAGNIANSADFTFQTTASDLAAPTVTLTTPTTGMVASNAVTLSVSATDNVGGSGVAGVTFLVDGNSIATLTSAPYSLSWNSSTVSNGNHTVQARAVDGAGNQAFSSVVTITSQNITVSSNGPIGSWKFDEASGLVAADSSGYGNTGQLTNGPTHVAGKVGNGLQFSGVEGSVRVPHTASLQVTNALTISAWVSLNSAGQWQNIMSKLLAEGFNAYPFSDYGLTAVAATGGFNARVSVTTGGSLNMLDSTNVLTYGVWHHLAGVYNGDSLRIYVDGVLSGTSVVTGNVGTSGQPLFIGCNGAGGDPLSGQIDEVLVFRRALTSAEILMLKGQAPQPPTNLHTN